MKGVGSLPADREGMINKPIVTCKYRMAYVLDSNKFKIKIKLMF